MEQFLCASPARYFLGGARRSIPIPEGQKTSDKEGPESERDRGDDLEKGSVRPSFRPVVQPHAADIMRNPSSSLLARSFRSDKTGMALKGRRNCNLSHYSLSERGMFYPLSGSVDPSVRAPGSQRSRDKRQRGRREGRDI